MLKARRAKDHVTRPQNVDDTDADELDSVEYSPEEAEQDTEYLKMTSYAANTAHLIEEKLKLTAKYRHNKLLESNVNIVKQFPYFIKHPHLVL